MPLPLPPHRRYHHQLFSRICAFSSSVATSGSSFSCGGGPLESISFRVNTVCSSALLSLTLYLIAVLVADIAAAVALRFSSAVVRLFLSLSSVSRSLGQQQLLYFSVVLFIVCAVLHFFSCPFFSSLHHLLPLSGSSSSRNSSFLQFSARQQQKPASVKSGGPFCKKKKSFSVFNTVNSTSFSTIATVRPNHTHNRTSWHSVWWTSRSVSCHRGLPFSTSLSSFILHLTTGAPSFIVCLSLVCHTALRAERRHFAAIALATLCAALI